MLDLREEKLCVVPLPIGARAQRQAVGAPQRPQTRPQVEIRRRGERDARVR